MLNRLTMWWNRLPPRFRTRKWVIAGALVSCLLVYVIAQWIDTIASNAVVLPPEPTPAPVAAAPTTPPLLEPTIPAAYRFEHFIDELHDCHRQRKQNITEVELERQVMADLPGAIAALIEQYETGDCVEPPQLVGIPGRLNWMVRTQNVQ